MFSRSNCFFISVLVSIGFGKAVAQQGDVDSLNLLLKNTKHDTTRVKIYWSLSEAFFSSRPDTVIPLCYKALSIIDLKLGSATPQEKHSFLITKASALNTIGSMSNIQGQLKEGLESHRKALKIWTEIGSKKGEAYSLNGIAYIYDNQGQIKEALDYYHRSIKILEEIRDKKGLAIALNNVGYIYMHQNQFQEALNCYNRSLIIRVEIGDSKGMGNLLNNIGLLYNMQGQTEKALEYFQRALKLREEIQDNNGIANSLNNIGALHLRSGQTEGALKEHRQALKIYEEILDKRGISNSLYRIGNVLLKQKKIKEAETYVIRSLAIAQLGGYSDKIRDAEKLLAQVDSSQGDFRNALEHYKQFIYYRDSLLNEANTKKAVQIQMQYEFSKQQTADSITNVEQVKQEELKHGQEIKQQKIYTYGGAIGFLLMVIVAGTSFRAYKQKQRANHIITEQKLLVEEKQKDILDSIHYAKRIQRSLLPTGKYIERTLNRLNKK